MEFIEKVKLFNEIAGQPEEFNPRKVALYTGLVCEEFAEMIDSYGTSVLKPFRDMLVAYGDAFKSGTFDKYAKNIDRVEFLDGCIDVAVVSTGAAISDGADIVPAFHHIADNNLSKYDKDEFGNYIVLRDENGKIMKPSTFTPPDINRYLK